MTIDNLEKELKLGQLHSLYLLYGEELYLLESNLKRNIDYDYNATHTNQNFVKNKEYLGKR